MGGDKEKRPKKGTLARVMGGLAIMVVLLSQVACTQIETGGAKPTAAPPAPSGPSAGGQAGERASELLRAAEAHLEQAGPVSFDMDLRIQIESAEAQVEYTGVLQTPDRSQGTVRGFPIDHAPSGPK